MEQKNIDSERMKKIFSERFSLLRKKEGASQAEFSKKLGISRVSIGLYESGERLPDMVGLRKIAIACGVSSDWLIGLSNDKEQEKSAIDELNLSAAAIENLKRISEVNGCEEYRPFPNILSYIFEDDLFERIIYDVEMAMNTATHAEIIEDSVKTTPTQEQMFNAFEVAEKCGLIAIGASEAPVVFCDSASRTFSFILNDLVYGLSQEGRDCLLSSNGNEPIENFHKLLELYEGQDEGD